MNAHAFCDYDCIYLILIECLLYAQCWEFQDERNTVPALKKLMAQGKKQ